MASVEAEVAPVGDGAIEAAAVAAAVVPGVAPGVSAAGSVKRSKKNKKVPAAAVAAAAKEEEEAANNMATVDHPYLSFLHKRIRSNKKKLEKIKGLELAQVADGKVLNPQQRELVGSKPVLEKLVVEFETLREQFIEVYLQEEAAKKTAEQKSALEEEEKAAALIDVVLEATAPELEATPSSPQAVEAPRDEFAHVEELLKTLHVVTLHQALGKDVPMVLDFFSKVLIGNTRPPAEVSYTENLRESLDQAKKYLTTSDELFACDMSYAGLREIVDELDKSAATPTVEEAEANGAEVVPVEERSGELPRINFFTDSQLEPEDAATDDGVNSPADDEDIAQVRTEEVMTEVAVEAITTEGTVTIARVAPAQVPSPSALPIPSPPKSFAAVASGGSGSPSGSNRSPSPTTDDSGNDARGKSGAQRRRGGPRPKKENSNSTSSSGGGGGGKGDGSEGGKGSKPRRPRPNRGGDESAGDKQASRGGFKDRDRRARADLSFRKHNLAQQHEPAPVAPNA